MLKVLDIMQHDELPKLTIDEYVPIKIRWDNRGGTIVHWIINNDKTLVDFAIDQYFGTIRYIACPLLKPDFELAQQTSLKHFPQNTSTFLGYPKLVLDNLKDAGFRIRAPSDVKLNAYLIEGKIYFLFGNQPATRLVKSGLVTFGISEQNELCGFITELTASEYQSLKMFHNVESDI